MFIVLVVTCLHVLENVRNKVGFCEEGRGGLTRSWAGFPPRLSPLMGQYHLRV